MVLLRRSLTLALSGEAAVASAKPAGDMIDGHHGEPDSGLVRFNALLGGRVWSAILAGLVEVFDGNHDPCGLVQSLLVAQADYPVLSVPRRVPRWLLIP